MKFKLLLFLNSILLLNTINCEEEIKERVLNRNDFEAFPVIEKQNIQEYSPTNITAVDTTFEDVIDEIIDSSRQGRNIDGLDEVYADPTVKQALLNGDDTQARNLIRDKLCSLGLMECEKRAPVRYIYTQPPPGAVYNSRPVQRPPPSVNGIYGPPRPVPIPGSHPQQPPRKVGYAPSHLNQFQSSKPIGPIRDKYSTDFFDVEQSPSSIKFGYTDKPTIVVNQGKREAAAGSQNTHIHHHYVHTDGNVPAVVDGTKTVLVNTPISEYAAVNHLSGSYQTSGFGSSSAGSNGFSPSNNGFEYKGVNSGNQGIYGHSTNVKPVIETNPNQYASGGNYNQYQQQQQQQHQQQQQQHGLINEGTNGIYSNGGVGSSFHSSAPDYYKKELNLNGNRGNGLTSSNFYNSQQQQQQYSNKYNKYNQGEQYQGFESARQDQYECVCTPFDQCAAQDVVGRRDDLILPLDPRNLPTEIEADSDNSTVTTRDVSEADKKESSEEVKKISKRQVNNDVERVQGEGRIFGFGGPQYGGGHYPAPGFGGKKIIPTLGVSFGLPFPTPQHGYPITPFGNHIQNPHFGAYTPNGLNLGLINVNPLFSLQVTKSEHGEKLVKPFVNLHVTPNENIVGRIGKLLAHKKGALHNHYHNHVHRYPPPPPPPFPFDPHHHHHHHQPPPFEGPILSHPPGHIFEHGPPHGHIFEHGPPGPIFEHGPPHLSHGPPHLSHGPPHLSHGPILSHPPPSHFHDHIITKPHHSFKDSHHGIIDDLDLNPLNPLLGFRHNNVTSELFPPNDNLNLLESAILKLEDVQQEPEHNQQSFFDNDYNYQSLYPENFGKFEGIQDDTRYARQYSNYDKHSNKKLLQSIPTQAPGAAKGSAMVSFPTSRRRRDTDQVVPASIDKKVSLETVDGGETNDQEGRAYTAGKRQAFYQQPKQCGPRAVCCRKSYRVPQQALHNPQFQQQQQQHKYNRCGVRNSQGINGRIKNPVYIDGDSEFGEYPWQAAILKKDPKESVYVCGGTLIDANHIITAAHCVKTYSGFDLRVRLGEWDVNHDVEFYPYVERDVISVHVHPEYYAGTLDNDLAILKLSQPVDFSGTPHISPACLPDKFTDFSRQRCWTTGWGKDNWEYGKYQNILKEVDVPIIDQNTCQNQLRQTRLGYNYVLNPGFICAGGEEGKDACKGDGGGPLVCERNGVWQVAGIVSWGIGCGKANVPGVYVRVAHYLDWIAQITQRY